MNGLLTLLSHDWAGLALAGLVAGSGWLWLRFARTRGWRWGRWLGAVWLVVAALLTLGAGYHLVHMAQVRAQYPPPGKLVDVGGYRIHLLAEGDAQGRPTVVWMPGAHGAGFTLHHLHRALREQTRSILVDRPGSGWSDIGPLPRTTAGEAEEVFTALQAAGERGPFLLVGHSLGGLLVANIARRHPESIAGVVLLDATPPDAINYAPPNPFLAQMRRDAVLALLQRLFGLHTDLAEKLWPPSPEARRIGALTEQHLGTAGQAVRAIEDGARSMAANASIFAELAPGGMGWDNTVYDGDLGDLPVFLVAPGELQEFSSVAKAMAEAGSAVDRAALDAQRLRRFYLRTRERYMAVSSRAQRIYAPKGTGHNFPYEAPEFVVGVLRGIVAGGTEPQAGPAGLVERAPGS